MDIEAQLRTLIGQELTQEIWEGYDWIEFYPVVSNNIIIDVFNTRNATPAKYRKKPVRYDAYIDADAEDEEVSQWP